MSDKYLEKYMKEIKIKEKTKEETDKELIKSIVKTKIELVNANKNFEYAEGELIDCYSYQIKSLQAKLDYLIKKVKQRGLILDMINAISIEDAV